MRNDKVITENTGMIGTYYSGWNNAYGYGYLWWVRRLDDKIDIPYAMGHGGQRIVFIPNANAVLVTQAEPNPKPPTSSYKRHRAIDSLLFDNFSYFLLNSLDPSNKKSDFFLRPTLHPFG
jgi:CubicO group peptidase (beta-lactamase class C family)